MKPKTYPGNSYFRFAEINVPMMETSQSSQRSDALFVSTLSVGTFGPTRAGSQTVKKAFRPQGNSSQPQPQGGQVEGSLYVGQSYHSAALPLRRLTLSLLGHPLPPPVVYQTAVYHPADSSKVRKERK